MKTRIALRFLVSLLALVLIFPLAVAGCRREQPKPLVQAPASPGNLASTLVPNINLDVYLYARQDNPTTVPGNIAGLTHDTKVESLAIWGVPAQEGFVFGVGITLVTAADASELYDKISAGSNAWKKLAGNTVYLVTGSGTAVEPLKTAISTNDFKRFDNSDFLEAASALPNQGATRLAAIGVGQPGKNVINLVSRLAGKTSQQAESLLGAAQISAVAVGLYSPAQVDVAQIVQAQRGGNISNLNAGLLLLVKSSLPGIIVEPIVSGFLKEPDFTRTTLGEITVYRGSWGSGYGKVPVLVRLNGNRIFAAIAAQESYAENLITNVK